MRCLTASVKLFSWEIIPVVISILHNIRNQSHTKCHVLITNVLCVHVPLHSDMHVRPCTQTHKSKATFSPHQLQSVHGNADEGATCQLSDDCRLIYFLAVI
jgi:hypothetical protein